MSAVGRVIQDFHCDGYAGKRFDLFGAVVISDGGSWVVVRLLNGGQRFLRFFDDDLSEEARLEGLRDRKVLLDRWCQV